MSREGVRLGAEQLAMVARLGTRRRLRVGQVLFREGGDADAVYVVLAGEVRVTVGSANGEVTTLAELGDGELVGELGVLDRGLRSATATVMDAGSAVALRAEGFEQLMLAHPAVAVSIVRALGSHLRRTTVRLTERQSGSVAERVAGRLAALADAVNADGGVDSPVVLTRVELASWVGVTRETVSRALSTFRDQGLVVLGRGKVTVVSAEGIRAWRE
ncbi:MAG: CRP/FNR family cyclic AMP-dependent transcriptional regulator [Candidatus Poriferisodalaceae bacterium]|jgi:CRP/FNR family cyclic AMP-dependent transcriptional regulator